VRLGRDRAERDGRGREPRDDRIGALDAIDRNRLAGGRELEQVAR
jgi:hypothetical protein